MELILVRHGQPAWFRPDGTGDNDPGLTDLGHAQAAQAATRLADSEDEPARGDVDRLVVSPMLRAQQTAAPIAAALGLEVETLDWLAELGMPPAWEGSPREVIEEAFATFQHRTRDEWWEGHPGGESLRAFHDRIAAGILPLLASVGVEPADEPGLWSVEPPSPEIDRVVAVAHGGTNGSIIARLLGVPPEPWEWDRFSMGHASFAVLRTVPVAGRHIWSLRGIGDGAHLPVDDRTF
ncbi:MAG: histidine phosphatase family protein [Actinobacteria bacterium]|nr:histidine phosphatase family protein [Actinomycetota bacterium]